MRHRPRQASRNSPVPLFFIAVIFLYLILNLFSYFFQENIQVGTLNKVERLTKDNLLIQSPVTVKILTATNSSNEDSCSKDPCLCAPRLINNPEFEMLKDYCEYEALNLDHLIPRQSKSLYCFIIILETDRGVLVDGWLNTFIKSLDKYYPFQADIMALHEGMSELQLAMLQRVTHRRVIFVNVKEWFTATEVQKSITFLDTCNHGMGYRLMCRFASGPIYWLEELKAYDYIIRMDDDSRFTKNVTQDLVKIAEDLDAIYGYAVVGLDVFSCYSGAGPWLERWVKTTNHSALGRPLIPFRPNKKFHSKGYLRYMSPFIYNSNFEIVKLDYFRHQHYRTFWKSLDESDLFISIRLGDHEVKTIYLSLFLPEHSLVCFSNLPYSHPHLVPCSNRGLIFGRSYLLPSKS